MQTRVIVVSEQDAVVRIYVGIPEAKQMDQTGQFTIAGPVDPTALADMAIDLASHFGWLNGTPEVPAAAKAEPAKAVQAAKAIAKPKKTNQHTERMREAVRCPMCNKAMIRNSLDRHLEDVHKVRHTEAVTTMRAVDRDDEARSEIRKRPAEPAKRHGRQGLVGKRILETEILPAVLAWMTEQPEPVTSADIAQRWKVGTSTGLDWLRKLVDAGKVREEVNGNPTRRSFVLVPEPVAALAEPVTVFTNLASVSGTD